MKRSGYSFIWAFVFIPVLLLGQKVREPASITISPVEGAVPYTHLDFNDRADRFQFAIVTDRTGGHRPGIFLDAVNKLNLMQPEFVMSVGDLIEGYTEDTTELIRQWNEFDAFVHRLQMPFFYVPGNHDITNQVMENLWVERLGNTYYHFVYQDVLFLALNSEDQRRGAGRGTISDEQFTFIKNTLEHYPDVRWTLVFLHQPLWHQKETNRWAEVEALLAGRKHTVFAGHEHRYVREYRNQGNYFTLATTGGGSRLRGPGFGEFDHMVWVTMTPEGPVVANLMLEGIWDENVVTKDKQDWIRKVSGLEPFQIEPVLINFDPFMIGGGVIKITNDLNIPMEVRFEEKNSRDLTGIVELKELTVEPNSVQEIRYSLRCREDRYDEPFELLSRVRYLSQDENLQLDIPFSFKLKPIPKRVLSRISTPVKVDGNEDDWADLPYIFSGDEDFEAAFDIRYDDEYIYMAMRVMDKHVYTTGKGAAWMQDNAGFGFSAEPLVRSAMNTGRNYYAEVFFLMITPENEKVGSRLSSQVPEGTLYKCVQKPYGYFAEAAVPVGYVETRQGKNWRTLRVAAAADDFDPDGQTRYWWLPSWRENDNYIGSGLFWREP
jgi:hypothetical protein